MKLTTFLEGVGIGAAVMFLADPTFGGRRRALLKDQANHHVNKKREALDVMVRDFSNRAQGIQAKVKNKLEGGNGEASEALDEGRPTVRDGRWTPATGLLMSGTAVMLGLYGMGRRGLIGGALQLASLGMIVKAFHDTEHRFDPSPISKSRTLAKSKVDSEAEGASKASVM